jgi:hypothetical protein
VKLNYESILKRANELYCQEKTKHMNPEEKAVWASRGYPTIASDQVKCAIKAIVEALNKER